MSSFITVCENVTVFEQMIRYVLMHGSLISK
jgi:hypothetical protein